MIKQSLYDRYNNKKMVQSTHLLSNMAQYKEKTTKANSRLNMICSHSRLPLIIMFSFRTSPPRTQSIGLPWTEKR